MAKGIRVGGPVGPFRDGVEQALQALGYSEGRVAQLLLVMAHLSRWLEERDSGVGDLTAETVEEFFVEFGAHHRWCRSSRSLAPVLEHLRSIEVVPSVQVESVPPSAEEELLAGFEHYLRNQRGLRETTVEAYRNYAMLCLRAWWPDGQVAPAELGAADIVAVVRSGVDAMRPPSLRCMVTALRSLLRFFHATGRTSRSLVEAVPAMASWPRTALPAPVTAGAAARLVASCDSARVAGRRDVAILTMLTRLGLRAGEVAALTLDDVDWRAGELRIKGKGGRVDRLPLPADVGEVLVSYLRDGRPGSRHRAVFLKVTAPYRPITRASVGGVVALACDRAGMARFGPHRLRHLVATETLRAGASLSEVAQLLRHTTVSTSAIYAIPDPAAVAALAKPWPEVTR
ncbi:MAG: tyrosine-type recombinase/integrase [Acidimicrobiales bacterium]